MSDSLPTVVITGGRGTLGTALREAFTAAGWNALAPGRDELDVTNEANVAAYFRALPRLDTLVCNAGNVRNALLHRATAEDFQAVLDVHLKGAFLCARAAIPLFEADRSGHLLFIGSRSARSGPRGQANYAAAKAGFMALSRSLASELGPKNIRSNVILPGFMETRMTADLKPDVVEAQRRATTLGRFNTPANAARAIAFLASLDHVSGQVFTLDSRIDPWC